MPFSDHVPPHRRIPLAWLGRTNWLTPCRDGFQYSKAELQKILNASLQFGKDFAYQVRDIINLSVSPEVKHLTGLDHLSYANLFFMASKALCSGQKTIRLSSDWCEAFENTELTLRFRDYRQPFPTMIVELPNDYATNKRVPQSLDYPECVLIHFEESRKVILIEIQFRHSQTHLSIPFSVDDDIETVLKEFIVMPTNEAAFTKTPGIEDYLAPLMRIALNAVVAMVYGTDWHKLEPSYLERKATAQIKAQTKSRDAVSARMAKLRLKALPEIYEFKQTTDAFLEAPPESDDTTGSQGTPRKPHWRRGHWRRQAVGPGRAERRLQWIRPMLIRADRFKGDLKDTSVTYRAKRGNELSCVGSNKDS